MLSVLLITALVLIGVAVLVVAWLPEREEAETAPEFIGPANLAPFSPEADRGRRMPVPMEPVRALVDAEAESNAQLERSEQALADLFDGKVVDGEVILAAEKGPQVSEPAAALTDEGGTLDVRESLVAEDLNTGGEGIDGEFGDLVASLPVEDVWADAAFAAEDVEVQGSEGDLADIFSTEVTPVAVVSTETPRFVPAPAEVQQTGGEVRYRRRKADKAVSLAKFPYDPEVWDDPLPPRKRRRLQKRAEVEQKKAAEAREKAYRRVERAKAERAALGAEALELEKVTSDGVLQGAGKQDSAKPDFQDVWSRAANVEAPTHDAIEQPGERVARRTQRKAAARAAKLRKKAEKADAKLSKLLAKQPSPVDTSTVVPAPAEQGTEYIDTSGRGIDAQLVVEAEHLQGSGAVVTAEVEVGDHLTAEILENLPVGTDVMLGGEELSEREQKRAEKRAENESRKLEKLAAKRAKKGEKPVKARRSKSTGSEEPFQVEGTPGLGEAATSGWDEVALEEAVKTTSGTPWESASAEVAPTTDEITASLWEEALGTEDGLQAAAVSSWEAAARGVTEFIDPTGGVRHTDVQELVDLGEAIEDTPEAGEGRGREAIIDGADAEDLGDTGLNYDAVVEMSASTSKKRRAFRKKKRDDEYDDEGVTIGDWISDGATVVTVTSDAVDHHEYDLPEPIPDRVQVAFGNDE